MVNQPTRASNRGRPPPDPAPFSDGPEMEAEPDEGAGPGEVLVPEGAESATLRCRARGVPGVELSWERNGRSLSPGEPGPAGPAAGAAPLGPLGLLAGPGLGAGLGRGPAPALPAPVGGAPPRSRPHFRSREAAPGALPVAKPQLPVVLRHFRSAHASFRPQNSVTFSPHPNFRFCCVTSAPPTRDFRLR
ncbi:collagen alpha-1(II) chain-like [Passer montanus]|uniref:collagen alpha-1(II) chain-like n=1 Tax=Passer montanus TaxID=9160 RepID=UPI0019600852|nr:collagen alpha-1(II) chain-like [Passer montanus]